MNKQQALEALRASYDHYLPEWWDHPMSEGSYETGCWTAEGNSIALTIHTTSMFNRFMVRIFEDMLPCYQLPPSDRIAPEAHKYCRRQAYRLIDLVVQEINNASDPEDYITLTPTITRDVENWLIRMFSYWEHDNELQSPPSPA